MKVFISGGAGLVGSHCAEFYAQRDNEVTILDNLIRSQLFGYNKDSVEYNWNYLAKYKNIKRIKGDVRNDEDLKRSLEKDTTLIIHTAGQPGVPTSMDNPRLDFSINAKGTLNVLEMAHRICPQATICYCSTNKIYGENVDKIPLREIEKRYQYASIINCAIEEAYPIDLTGHTPYGCSKLTGDLYTQEYGHLYGMKTGVFRMSCTYGTRQFGFEDQGWIAWFIIATLFDKEVTIFGNGKQVRDLLYVTDLVEAFDKFYHSDIQHITCNIGGGINNTMSLLELIEAVELMTGKKLKYKFADWRPSDQKVYISDITKIKKELNWQPEVIPETGISWLINWIKENEKYFK